MWLLVAFIVVIALSSWVVIDVPEQSRSRSIYSSSTKWFLSPVLWGTLLGGIWGIFGIPVRVPARSWWQWVSPSGFEVASVLACGTIGFLVGLVVELILDRRRQNLSVRWFWAVPFVAFAMVYSVVGYARLQAVDTENEWTLVRTGLIRADATWKNLTGVQNYPKLPPSVVGVELKVAGADIGASSQFFADRREDYNLQVVASAFAQAGDTFLASDGKGSDFQREKRFVIASGQIIEKSFHVNRGIMTPKNTMDVVNQLASNASDQSMGWPSN